MAKKGKYICRECGSDEVNLEPVSCLWSYESQDFEVIDICDKGHCCPDCDTWDARVDWVETDEEHVPVLDDIWKQIRAFSDECEAAEYTDTGDAWDLLDRLYNLAGGPIVNDTGPQV